jgi:hypothetical protein
MTKYWCIGYDAHSTYSFTRKLLKAKLFCLERQNIYKQRKFFQRIEEPNGRSPTGSNPLGFSISWKLFSLQARWFEAKLHWTVTVSL